MKENEELANENRELNEKNKNQEEAITQRNLKLVHLFFHYLIPN